MYMRRILFQWINNDDLSEQTASWTLLHAKYSLKILEMRNAIKFRSQSKFEFWSFIISVRNHLFIGFLFFGCRFSLCNDRDTIERYGEIRIQIYKEFEIIYSTHHETVYCMPLRFMHLSFIIHYPLCQNDHHVEWDWLRPMKQVLRWS